MSIKSQVHGKSYADAVAAYEKMGKLPGVSEQAMKAYKEALDDHSHAILGYNRDRRTGLSDGVVITPSHNPPECGGFKYNPPHGGPAEEQITSWIEACANGLLTHALDGVKRVPSRKPCHPLPRTGMTT